MMRSSGMPARPLLLLLLFAISPSCGGGGKGTPAVRTPLLSIGKAQGFDGTPLALAPAIDGTGRIYLGGGFQVYGGGFVTYLVCLNADGTINSGFNTGTGLDTSVRAIAPISDGSGDLYVGGDFTAYNGTPCGRIIRLSSTGAVRSSFVLGTGFDASVQVIAPATDGSGDLYVGGDFQNYNGTPTSRIVRLQSDGSINTGFNVGTGFDSTVSAIVPATDGSGDVYVGGNFTTYNGGGSLRIIRLHSNGTVTGSFSIGTGCELAVRSIAVAVDGSGDVIVGGDFTLYNGTTVNSIVRLHATGAIVSAFATGTAFDAPVNSVISLSDGTGDILVGGSFANYNGTASNSLIRLRSDGSLSPSLSIGTGFNAAVTLIAPAGGGSGDLLLAGPFTAYNGVGCNHFLRLHAGGTVDPSIPTGTGFNSTVRALLADPAGSGAVTVGGAFTYYNGKAVNRLVRLLPSGDVDPSFVVGNGFNNDVECLAAGPGGTVYVGGPFTIYKGAPCFRLVRLLANGSVDTSFNVGTGTDSSVNSIVAATDGSGDIYCGGAFTGYSGTPSNRIIRIQSNGAPVGSFAVGSGFNGTVIRITPLTDGSGNLYVTGLFTSYKGTPCVRIVRLQSNGSIDATLVTGTGFSAVTECAVPAPDASGNVYVGGDFTAYNGTGINRLVRLTSAGGIDGTFSVGTGFLVTVISVLPAAGTTGAIYVAGDLLDYKGTFVNGLVRLKSDGSIDSGFAVGAASVSVTVNALAYVGDGSGDLYAGGSFKFANGMLRDGIVRIGADGTVR